MLYWVIHQPLDRVFFDGAQQRAVSLLYVAQDTVEFIQAAIGKHQLAPAFGAMLYPHGSPEPTR